MKNKLGYLSLLSLLSILGFATENKGFYSFLSFLVFIRYFFVIPDELFKLNVQRAATPAFFIWIASSGLSIFIGSILMDESLLSIGMTLSMSLSIFVFIVHLVYCEFKESNWKNHDH